MLLPTSEKRVAEDEMAKEHYQLNGHESEQIPGDFQIPLWRTEEPGIHVIAKS